MRFDDGADRGGGHIRVLIHHFLCGDQGGLGKAEGLRRPVAAAHIQDHLGDAVGHRDLRPHTVGPEPVNDALAHPFGRGDTKGRALGHTARRQADFDAVAFRIDPGGGEQLPQPDIDAGRRADFETFQPLHIALLQRAVDADHQKPVHALAQRTEDFRSLPARKGPERRMGRSGDEFRAAIAQRLETVGHGKDQLMAGIQPFFLEKTELHRGDRREIRVRNQIGQGNTYLHDKSPKFR